MKKYRIILLSLILAFGLMGAGYAAWSDTLYIDHTIKTGELAFSFTEDGEIVCHDLNNDDSTLQSDNKFYNGAECTAEGLGESLEVNVHNAYPGATFTVSSTILNESTVPARLAFTTDFNPDEVKIIGISVDGVPLDYDEITHEVLTSASELISPNNEGVFVQYTLLVVDPDDPDNPGGAEPIDYDTLDTTTWGNITDDFDQGSSFTGKINLTFVQDTFHYDY